MNDVKFIKTFNKGQVTIPKEIRDSLGLAGEFWLKIYAIKGRIIAEPVEKEKNRAGYMQKLLKIKGDWFDSKEIASSRKQIEKQIVKRSI